MTQARELKGVTGVSVERETWMLTLRFDTAVTDERTLVAAIDGIVARID